LDFVEEDLCHHSDSASGFHYVDNTDDHHDRMSRVFGFVMIFIE
jgi:hypothetical protein